MTGRKLANWLKTYMEYTAYNEAPEHFHFWTGVSVIAAALRRKVWIDMRYFQWAPNFYIILVAPPGIVNKSTTIGIGRELLGEIEGINFGPSSITWQSLITDLSACAESVPMTPTTFQTMSNLTFHIGELGTFVDFQDRRMIDVLVDLWDNRTGAWEKSTKMSGREAVVNPWMNILGATTPAWLADNLPVSMIGGGFTSRCIWLFSTKKKCRIAYPQRQVVPATLDKMKKDLVEDLKTIADLRGEFVLTEDAYKFGEAWYDKHSEKLEANDAEHDTYGGYHARTQTQLHKLAMVISASQRSDLIISRADLESAAALVDSLESDIPRVFKTLHATEEMGKAHELVAIVQSHKQIRRAELYQKYFFHTMTAKEFGEALQAATEAGYVMQINHGATVWVRAGSLEQAMSGTAS